MSNYGHLLLSTLLNPLHVIVANPRMLLPAFPMVPLFSSLLLQSVKKMLLNLRFLGIEELFIPLLFLLMVNTQFLLVKIIRFVFGKSPAQSFCINSQMRIVPELHRLLLRGPAKLFLQARIIPSVFGLSMQGKLILPCFFHLINAVVMFRIWAQALMAKPSCLIKVKKSVFFLSQINTLKESSILTPVLPALLILLPILQMEKQFLPTVVVMVRFNFGALPLTMPGLLN